MLMWFVLICAFASAALMAVWMFDALFPDEARRRLADLVEASPSAARRVRRNHLITVLARITEPLSRLATPDGDEFNEFSLMLTHAGLRHRAAPPAFFGVKATLTLLLPLTVVAAMSMGATERGHIGIFAVLVPAAIGYYLPNAALRWAVHRRKQLIVSAMPDAVDLMTICVEAGLGMDAAMTRVADELVLSSPILADELKIIGMETRAGLSRGLALRNFYARTGVDEVDSFVTMVSQAERFGTGIAEALRVHSDTMRTRRRQRIEEQGSKVGTKLLFPLILCVFPFLLLVLVGPAIIQLAGLFAAN